jgi:hypothetical protein
MGISDIVSCGKLYLSNYPNPFTGNTTFAYTLPCAGKVTIEIRNMLGVVVKTLLNNEEELAGNYKIKTDDFQFESGVYTATLKLNNSSETMTRNIKIVHTN